MLHYNEEKSMNRPTALRLPSATLQQSVYNLAFVMSSSIEAYPINYTIQRGMLLGSTKRDMVYDLYKARLYAIK